MLCTTIKKGQECPFMTKKGCSYNGGACQTLVEQCTGCTRVVELESGWYLHILSRARHKVEERQLQPGDPRGQGNQGRREDQPVEGFQARRALIFRSCNGPAYKNVGIAGRKIQICHRQKAPCTPWKGLLLCRPRQGRPDFKKIAGAGSCICSRRHNFYETDRLLTFLQNKAVSR